METTSLLDTVTGDMRIIGGLSVILLLFLWKCFRSTSRSQVTVVFKRVDAAGLQQLSATVAAALAETRPSANDEALQRVAESVERLRTLHYQFQNDIIKAHEQIWQGLCSLKDKGHTSSLKPVLEPIKVEPIKPPSKPASRKVSETAPDEHPKSIPEPEERLKPVPVKSGDTSEVSPPEPKKSEEKSPVRSTDMPRMPTAPKVEEHPKPLELPADLPKPVIKPPELPKNLPKPPKPEEIKSEGEVPPNRSIPVRKPGVARPKYVPPPTMGNPFGK